MPSPPGSTLDETAMFPIAARSSHPEFAAANTDHEGQPGPAPWIAQALEGAALPDTPHVELRPGDQVPGTRYVIERWLGDGGMGVVYEARHIDIDRKVALKVLRHELCKKPLVMQQFRDEARIVSRIGSENIATVHDFAELPDGRLLFVMELLRGGTVARELLQGPLDPARVIAILRQTCKALATAHAVNVVHRDLKPDNIALDVQRGRSDFVKLLDFGIAIVMSEADVATHLAAGTPSYLAPEVILGRPADARVDVYAAGCTAYEMLVGHPPFRGETIEAVLRGHLEEQPRPPHLVRPEVPLPLSRVVMHCLAKPAAGRYPSMVELEAALCEAQIEAKLNTSWDDLPVPEIDPARKVELLRQMPDPQGSATSSPRRIWILAALALVVLAALGAWWVRGHRPKGEREPIEALSLAAYEAAARSYFVYPPPDAPKEPTAYGLVVELESRAAELGTDATAEAKRLRDEFAATLVRLGDDYWERDGGKPFAIDYYAEALVFVPEHAHAASRAILTPGQLAMLREKAETRSFSEAELIAAEPLIALAEPDPTQRSEKVAALRQRTRASTTDESLARLAVASPPPRKRSSASNKPAVAVASTPTSAPAAAEPIVATPPADAAPLETATTPSRQRDPEGAAAAVREGNQARDRGRLAEARRAFERALALDARSHAALIGLADVAFHGGDYARSATFARKAVKLAPRSADYRIRLGDAYFKAFRYDDARVEYEEARRLGHASAGARIAKVDAKQR